MKRYVAFLLAVCMILSVAALAGCGKKVVPVENGNPARIGRRVGCRQRACFR